MTPAHRRGGIRRGTVAVVGLQLHEDWAGRRVSELEAVIGARVAFLVRLGNGLLPRPDSAVQADDQVFVAAVSGTIAEAKALATAPPPAE